MIRLSRLTDYGIVLMSHMASQPNRVHNAAEVAAESHLPVPTVSKLLRKLAQEGFLRSQRGTKGGYSLAHPPEKISVSQLIVALEGPIGLTMCSLGTINDCEHSSSCPAREPWQRINQVVRDALSTMTLADMTPRARGGLRIVSIATARA